MFSENRVMFLVRPIQSLFLMRNIEADFGILPVPKVQENQQSYGSAVNPYSATLLCFPKTISDPERAGVILDALAWESHYTVIGPLYEKSSAASSSATKARPVCWTSYLTAWSTISA